VVAAEPRTAIVQTPQYFRAEKEQNWLERGAGAVQEIFYRSVQVSRQRGGGSVCCGSSAVYRRTALAEIGGCSLAEHSEDMHTGFDLRLRGWDLRYVPLVLSAGVCPGSTHSFLAQQYRWSLASFELVTSRTFWQAQIPRRMRMSYLSGAMHYLHTALLPLWAPLVPLGILLYFPETLTGAGALWLIPSLVMGGLVLPLWHRCEFSVEAFAVRMMCCWAHLFALAAVVSGRRLRWQPSGVDGLISPMRRHVWAAAVTWTFGTALAWLAAALWRFVTTDPAAEAVMLLLAVFDVLVAGRMLLQPDRTSE
jgi:cellulose synthase (UDP-forming)